MNNPKLSISILISRNYEGVKKCLDSVRPLLEQVSSELILTDTGCGEEVRGLIEGYTEHIIDFKWIKDFSAARNVGLKESKGEWFLYIDDDEWFDDVTELVRFFNSKESDRYNVAAYVQRNYLDINGTEYRDHNVDRIIRITPELHFEHRVHEAYTGIEIGKKKRLGTIAHHYGYVYKNEEEKKEKAVRNRELLELESKEYPEDMRIRHQLVMSYYGSKQYDEAIECALEGIRRKSDSMYWDALHSDLLYCLQAQEKWDSLIEYGEKFLGSRLFPFDEFGVRQYLVRAYWSIGQYDKVCDLAPVLIDTYTDYKKNPDKYDANQLMRDEFWQEDNIVKMLLFIIDSALATEDLKVIEKLLVHDIRSDLHKITNKTQYKSWFIQMLCNTCVRETQVEMLRKLPFINSTNVNEYIANITVEAPAIEFKTLEIEPEFFEEETRNDFYIEPLIKNAWAAQLQTLSMFDEICKVNNLIYSMDWGSLLGTVRHKGFIPWDDDLDVCMPREDLMKFYRIINNYPELECLNPYNAHDLGIHATRLNLSRDFTVERDKLKEYHGFPFAVGIDIFTIDYVPNDKEQEKKLLELMEKINYAANLLVLIEEHDEKEEDYRKAYYEYIEKIKNTSDIVFSKDNPELQELTVLYDEIQSAYNKDESDFVANIPCIMVGMDYYLPKSTYENIIRVPFETLMVPIPENYDTVLRAKYGDDYMTPVISGGTHEYPFYNEMIRSTQEAVGSNSFEDTKAHIEKISSGYYKSFINRSNNPSLSFRDEELERNSISRVQAALLETLEEIDRLCNGNGINYYYIGETEEEIDKIKMFSSESTDVHIGMKRVDYMRFQQIIQEELNPWFDYRSIYSNRDHIDIKTYIITDAYLTREGEYQTRFHGCNDIVGIDIAPIDIVNDDDSVEELKKNVITMLTQSAPSMPTTPPYSEEVLSIVREWEDMLHIGINIEGNLQNEFVKAADNVAMSDDNESYSRARITSDICDGGYRLYNKNVFD